MRARILKLIGLAIAMVMFLVACGATVDSTMTVDKDFKGTRTIIAKVSDSDLEEVEGGKAKVDAVLKSKVPDGMSYSGFKAQPEEDGQAATFTIEFDDLADYAEKIDGILTAGDVADDASIEAMNESEGLTTGFKLSETFSHTDLLAWAEKALLEAKVITDDQTPIFSTGDESKVTVDGKTYDSDYFGNFSVDEVEYNGFDQVNLEIHLESNTDIKVIGVYGNIDASTEEQKKFAEDMKAKAEKFDKGEVIPDDEIDKGVGSVGLTDSYFVGIQTKSVEDAQEAVRLVLDNAAATLTQETKESADGSTDSEVTYAGNNLTAPRLTTQYGSVMVTVYHPETWEKVGSEEGGDSGELSEINPGHHLITGDQFALSFVQPMAVKTLESETSLGANNSVEQTITFTVDEKFAKEHSKAIKKDFDPGKAGSIEASDKDTKYTVKISGDDPKDLSKKMTKYLGNDWSFSTSEKDGFFFPKYRVRGDFGAMITKFGGGGTDKNEIKIQLPAMNSFEEGKAADTSGGTATLKGSNSEFRLAAKGVSIVGMVVLGVIALVIIAVVIVLIFFRKRLAGLFGKSKKEDPINAGYGSHAVSAGAGAAPGMGGQAPPPPGYAPAPEQEGPTTVMPPVAPPPPTDAQPTTQMPPRDQPGGPAPTDPAGPPQPPAPESGPAPEDPGQDPHRPQ